MWLWCFIYLVLVDEVCEVDIYLKLSLWFQDEKYCMRLCLFCCGGVGVFGDVEGFGEGDDDEGVVVRGIVLVVGISSWKQIKFMRLENVSQGI